MTVILTFQRWKPTETKRIAGCGGAALNPSTPEIEFEASLVYIAGSRPARVITNHQANKQKSPKDYYSHTSTSLCSKYNCFNFQVYKICYYLLHFICKLIFKTQMNEKDRFGLWETVFLKYSYTLHKKTSPPILYSSRTLPLCGKNGTHLIFPWASVGFCWLFCLVESSRNDAFCCLILGPNSDIDSIFSILRRGSFGALSHQGGSLPWNCHPGETILSDYAEIEREGQSTPSCRAV